MRPIVGKIARGVLRALCALILIVLVDKGYDVQSVANRLGIALAFVVVALVGIYADKVIKY